MIAPRRCLLLGMAIGFWMVAAGGPASGQQADDGRIRLLVPAYFYPAGEGLKQWQRLIRGAADVPTVAIANPASGPGPRRDDNYTQVIRQAQGSGVRVIGYVSTNYGKRPKAEVKADVDQWLRWYPSLDGFFFDEQAAAADQFQHYAALFRYARSRRDEGLIVANPGTRCAREYFAAGLCDAICVFENSQRYEAFRAPERGDESQAPQLAALLHGCADVATMRRYVDASRVNRIRYLYITDDSGENPWDRLPSYWEAEVAELKRRNSR